ncbi:fungal-specific transcription factor domain-containing protein [Talaromyces proteolyticus]|uniref:Fungal-specific transcription factor domain-containing protein n=1 Tax=Talaromyces proteolyticus TaxID=1131652 RepID=A0AAD4KLA9_9EURO|nr:fungal-specific transcription factor domain-containing protein [Talaromyces proteolyticus]KAH8694003.1 fungal-specific transcription factor domain-containing protein [Talaromyces proteolyticus]
MKIKCQRKDKESCARCIARKLHCTTTPVKSKRQKWTDERESYFHKLENRIKRMESAIITPGLHRTAELVEGGEKEKSSFDEIENQARLSNHLSNLVVDSNGSSNFIGRASGFSLFSPQGIRWISEKVGDKDELAQLYRLFSKRDYGIWGHADANLWQPIPQSQQAPLPSKDIALQYVNCFFLTFNNAFPIINQDVFNSYLEQQYSTNPPAGTAWYALFNAVLCLGSIRTKGERRRSFLIDYTSNCHETGVEYFRNASCCFHDLIFKEANLMAMQAMTLMLFITTSSPNPQPAYVMASAAGNLANTLGLHRSLDGFGLAPAEIEQRRNVFWVFYMLEKAISRNLGRPSVINDDDIAVALPPKQPQLIQSPNRARVYDIFQDQIRLAIIGSRIYSELYSASAQTKSEVHRMKVLGTLDDHLQRWRDCLPVEIRPEHPINCSHEQYVQVAMMHFTYLDAVILLHRVAGNQESFEDENVARMNASQLLCLAAARRSIQLLDTFSANNMQNQHIMWLALYYSLSASLVLFTNILSNPQHQHAASDVRLMNLIISFITHSVKPGSSFAATPTVSVFKELFGIATRLVQSSQKVKRIPEGDDPRTTTSLAPHNSTTDAETEISARPSLVYDEPPLQEFTDNSPLEFAPFIIPESSQFDYNSTLSDSLLSATTFDWDMVNTWMPNLAAGPWPLAETDANMDDGFDYFYDDDFNI